jgi:hypothetical protein
MYSRYVVKTRRAQSKPPAAPVQTWPVNTVWAAAAHAQRINGDYIKYPIAQEDGVQLESNRDIMLRVLNNTKDITEQDIALGQAARDYHRRTLLFRALQRPLTEFETALNTACLLDEVKQTDRYSLAVIASQISGYSKSLEQDRVRGMVDVTAAPVGAVGTKVTAEITVIRSNYSVNYGVYFVNAVTSQGQPVFFSYRQNLQTGSKYKITGTVKALRDDATQLNRVKIKEPQ